MGLYPPAVMNNHLYTPLFCEENIWQLARQLITDGVEPETLQVIFISNPQKQVVLFTQRNGKQLGHVIWDYHVILRQRDENADRIYDFDSRLPFPCDCRDYMEATFGLQAELEPSLRAWLRLIPASRYLCHFYSDRSHMQGVVADENFPRWPAITPDDAQKVRLDEYWDMLVPAIDNSRVLSVDDFLHSELSTPLSPPNENG